MTPQELRNSIVHLAIQGKLVEQNEADHPISISSSYSGDISELYEVPERWKWVALKDVVTINTGLSFKKQDQLDSTKGTLRVLRGGNIGDDYRYHLYDDDTYVDIKPFQEKYISLCKGDVISPSVTSIEKICKAGFIDKDLGSITAGGFVYIIRCKELSVLEPKYLLYFVTSSFNKEQCKPNIHKSGQAFYNLKKSGLIEQPICLPPLAEQKRIVAKIEELLPLIDRYEQAWTKLETVNKRFPGDMQKSVLQMAIQGKLVEQRPEEGTAEELYQQIQVEKQKLIKEGRIKKKKPLPKITEDEIPFDIPEGWKWVRLIDVIDVRDGTHGTPGYLPSGYPLITGKDFYTGVFCLDKTQYISEVDYKEIIQRSKVEIDDILFSMIGGNIGSMIMITKDNYFEMAIKNVALFKQYNYTISLADYLFVFLKSQVPIFQAIAKGGAQSFVPLNMLRKYLFPLPPLAEQKRIVQKLEEFLPLCEKLK